MNNDQSKMEATVTGSQSDLGQLEPVHTVGEVAAVLRLSPWTIRLRIRHGLLLAFKDGRAYRIKKSDFDDYRARIGYTSNDATTAQVI